MMNTSTGGHSSSEVLYGRGLSGNRLVSFTIAGYKNLVVSSEGGTAGGRRMVKLSCTLSQLTIHAPAIVDVSQVIMHELRQQAGF